MTVGTAPRLVTSPGEAYAREMLSSLADATFFVLVTAFASVAGVEVVEPAIRAVLERGGRGRIVLAVDRRGFNAGAVFEALLALKASHGERMSIGVALEDSGLLHAKALFTEGPGGDRLLVGSANLTRSALSTNHELGVFLGETPSGVRRAFLQFVTSIAPRSLDGPDARAFLEARGFLAPSRARAPEALATAAPALAAALAKLRPLEPLDVAPEEHLAGWNPSRLRRWTWQTEPRRAGAAASAGAVDAERIHPSPAARSARHCLPRDANNGLWSRPNPNPGGGVAAARCEARLFAAREVDAESSVLRALDAGDILGCVPRGAGRAPERSLSRTNERS